MTSQHGTITVEKKNTNNDTLGSGFIFKITADEDIYNVAKTKKHYSKGDNVATITTDNTGIAKKSDLPLRALFSFGTECNFRLLTKY